MIENLPLKTDEVGRVVIPKKIRIKYEIKKDSFLLLKPEEKSILFIKQNKENKISNLISKLAKIESIYKLDFMILNQEKIIYASKKLKFSKKSNEEIKKLFTELEKNQRIDVEKLIFTPNSYYYSLINFDDYTKYLFIIFYKDEKLKKIASLICDLFS
ncbi:MAG: hypothetical protein ACI4PE_04205 [Bacilli bacterium]